jgi:dTDP-4-amino-4,6-dideoxygalactose transaminase
MQAFSYALGHIMALQEMVSQLRQRFMAFLGNGNICTVAAAATALPLHLLLDGVALTESSNQSIV